MDTWKRRKDHLIKLNKLESLQKDPNIFIDERDYNIYSIIHIAGQTWLGENLRYVIGDSHSSKTTDINYGRLYTFDAANMICPEGWRLAYTHEWKHLANRVAGDDLDLGFNSGKEAFKSLIKGGDSGFEIYLPGYYDQGPNNIDIDGDYWTATSSDDPAFAGVFYFNGKNENCTSYFFQKCRYRSIRCIKGNS